MWILFLGIGLLFISLALYLGTKRTDVNGEAMPDKPQPIWTKSALYALGVALWLASAGCLIALGFEYSTFTDVVLVIFCIVLFISGKRVFTAANETDTREAQNMAARANAKIAEVKHEQEQIALENARRNEASQTEVRAAQNQAQIASYQTQEAESRLRESLIEPASREQVSIDDWREVRVHEMKASADLNVKLAEMQAQVRLAILAKHLSDVEKISIVQDNIDKVIKQIDQIENDASISTKAKERMIADREDIINTLKEDRRARQQGLLEAHNG